MLRYEKGRLFSSEVFLDEFTDLDNIYLDLKCLHVLEILMENSDTLILMDQKGKMFFSDNFYKYNLCVCTFVLLL